MGASLTIRAVTIWLLLIRRVLELPLAYQDRSRRFISYQDYRTIIWCFEYVVNRFCNCSMYRQEPSSR